MRFIAVATASSTEIESGDFHRLYESLSSQVDRVVLVWRSEGASEDVLADISPDVEITRVLAAGVSVARNLGIQSARDALTREWVWSFPDDDCLYPDDLCRTIKDRLRQGYHAVCVPYGPAPSLIARDRFPSEARVIKPPDALSYVASAGLFVRGDILGMLGGFEERLGVGTALPSGEEVDLVLRALRTGAAIGYLPAPAVIHEYAGGERVERISGRLALLRAHARWSRDVRMAFLRTILTQTRALVIKERRRDRAVALLRGLLCSLADFRVRESRP